MGLPYSVTKEDMEVLRKEWLLMGYLVEVFEGIITVYDERGGGVAWYQETDSLWVQRPVSFSRNSL